jgi:hypothetical protein
MRPGDCFRTTGEVDAHQQVDAAVADGRMTPGDAVEVHTFVDFLRLNHEFGSWMHWPPNLLRQQPWRTYFGLTHMEIDQIEAALWRSEIARPETEAGR